MELGKRIALASLAVIVSHLAGFAMIFLVPSFKRRWDDFGVQLSKPQQLLLVISDFVSQYWFLILPAIFVAAILFVVLPLCWKRSAGSG